MRFRNYDFPSQIQELNLFCNISKFPYLFIVNYVPALEPTNPAAQPSKDQIWIIFISIFVTLIVMLVLWIFLKNRRNAKIVGNITDHELSNLPSSPSIQTNETNYTIVNPYKDINRQAALLSYDTHREIPRSLFSVTDYIGCGNFGNVCKGELKGLYGPKSITTVAIKSIDGPADGAELRDFLQEIKIMSYIKPHPFLVSMIGSCCSDEGDSREMWLIIEYCPHCDLKNYLIENKKQILSANEQNAISDRCLIYWAYEISKGMEYLAENKIMHGDLAARNILLDDNLIQPGRVIAKIADFGLSKKFYDNVSYSKESRVFVPWRWMALEYLTSGYFTLNSDVWSFGVVLWEIFSLGRLPYGHQDYDDVLQELENGYRLPCPQDVNEVTSWSPCKIYQSVSKLCFVGDSKERGEFVEVVKILENELTEEENLMYEALNKKYHDQRSNKYLNIGHC